MQARLNCAYGRTIEERIVANRKQRRDAERAGETAEGSEELLMDQDEGAEGGPAQPFPDHDEDVVFKVQMRVQNMVIGHWKGLLAVTAVVLLSVLGFGLWEAQVLEDQEAVQASIVKIDRKMPKEDPLALAGFSSAEEDPAVVGKVRSAAEQYESVAKVARGTGAVSAWMRAAAAWKRAGDTDAQAAAFASAHAVGVSGVVGWSASSAHASALNSAGDVDGSASVLRGLADTAQGLLAEQALLNLAELYEDAGRTEESRSMYEEFTTKYADSVLKDRAAGGLARVGAAK
jgi:tetratricopeptide (TPR) repeat protein